jgi:hypothetical protein
LRRRRDSAIFCRVFIEKDTNVFEGLRKQSCYTKLQKGTFFSAQRKEEEVRGM